MTTNNHLHRHQQQYKNLITHVLYISLIPFFICAFVPWIWATHTQVLTHYFLLYSSIALCFWSGNLWAISLSGPPSQPDTQPLPPQRRHLYLASICVICGFGSHLLSEALTTLILAGLHGVLLFWEKCFLQHHYTPAIQQLRHKTVFIQLGCHMMVFLNLIRGV